MKIIRELTALALLLPVLCFGKTFRIAGLYPSTTHNFNCTCGLEAACVVKAAVARAKQEGQDVSVELFDKKWTALETGEAALKVVDGGFDAAVGTDISSHALVAGDIFEKAGIPFIVPTATNPNVTAGKMFVTRIPFSDRRQALLLAKLTVKELRPSRVAVIKNLSDPYSNFLGDEYVKNLRAMSPKIQIEETSIIDGQRDMKTVLDKVMSITPELIFVPILPDQTVSLYSELANRNLKLTLLSSDTIEGDVVFNETAGRTANGIRFIFVKHWNGHAKGKTGARFLDLYRTTCSQFKPTMVGAASYDAISLLLETLKKYPDSSKQELVQRMKSVHFTGMTGALTYDKDGEPLKPLELFMTQGNKTVYWKRYE